MRSTAALLLSLTIIIFPGAAPAAADQAPTTYPLWPDGAPGARGKETGDAFHAGDVPTYTVYPPDPAKANGAAVVICPGGGYGFLATEHEGEDVARWLNTLGVTAVVLKYRLGPQYHHPAMLEDAQRAIRTVRARAREWHLDPGRVAVLGFSAGGHLASTVATHFDTGRPDASDPLDRPSCRPDLAILIYPVVALATPYGHSGSLKNLLGEKPAQELIESLSNERQVTPDTPPTFLAHTNEDKGVPAENSLLFAMALRRSGVPVELHLFEKGPHGLGMGTGWASRKIPPNEAFQAWTRLCATWLQERHFLTP
jgi:acetyl esterase/lipase